MTKPVGFMDIEMRGDAQQVNAMLERLSSALSGPMLIGFMGSVGEYLQSRARSRFASEGDDVSGAWHPLSDVTQHFRETQGFPASHPINKRTGDLEVYITQSSYSVTPNPLGATTTYPSGGAKTQGWLREKIKTAQTGKASPATEARPVLGMNERDLLYVMITFAFLVQTGRNR